VTDSVHFSSETCEWATPQDVFEEVCELVGLRPTLDVCATAENAKCERFFTKDDDGLKYAWTGVCWLNPPYGDPEEPCKPNCKKKRCPKRGFHIDKYVPGIFDWLQKAHESAIRGATVICLIPARTDTSYWHAFVEPVRKLGLPWQFHLLKGRVKFVGPNGVKNSAPFPSAVVVFDGGAR
jgi:phage N-6-adenine-methyltransferase